ncbi:MAG: hypothetical protein ACYC9R_06330 [Nitrosotalea sp.]
MSEPSKEWSRPVPYESGMIWSKQCAPYGWEWKERKYFHMWGSLTCFTNPCREITGNPCLEDTGNLCNPALEDNNGNEIDELEAERGLESQCNQEEEQRQTGDW